MKYKRTLRSILWFIPFLFSSFYGGEDTDINVYLRYDCFYCRSNFGKDQILLRNKSVIRNDSFIWTKDVTLKSALILILFFPTKRLRTLFWMLWTKPMGTFEKRKKKVQLMFQVFGGQVTRTMIRNQGNCMFESYHKDHFKCWSMLYPLLHFSW